MHKILSKITFSNLIMIMEKRKFDRNVKLFYLIYNMKYYKEKKIAGFQTEKKRIQLLQITTEKPPIINNTICLGGITKWQVRSNRKIIITTISRYEAEKIMCTIITQELLQQKYNF